MHRLRHRGIVMRHLNFILLALNCRTRNCGKTFQLTTSNISQFYGAVSHARSHPSLAPDLLSSLFYSIRRDSEQIWVRLWNVLVFAPSDFFRRCLFSVWEVVFLGENVICVTTEGDVNWYIFMVITWCCGSKGWKNSINIFTNFDVFNF